MSGDLISRETLKKAINNDVADNGDTYSNDLLVGLDMAYQIIDNAPEVDISGNEYFPYRTAFFNGVEAAKAKYGRPQGEWVEGYHDGFTTHDCSICGFSKEGTHLQYNFCPNCGAYMKGEPNEDR